MSPDKDGGPRFEFSEAYEQYSLLLCRAFEADSSIPPGVQEAFVLRALCKAARNGKLTERAVLRALCELEAEYLARPVEKYALCCQLSICNVPASCEVEGCAFKFSSHRPKGFEELASTIRIPSAPQGGVWARVFTTGRSDLEAGLRAKEALSVLRGLWNLYLNLHVVLTVSFGQVLPINKIRAGPLYSIHHPRGRLASQSYWYERDFPHSGAAADLAGRWNKVDEARLYWQRRMRTIRYGDTISQAISRYCTALDTPDLEAGCLKLWSVLEFLTIPTSGRSDDMIRRVSFLWSDQEHAKRMLHALRSQRNEQVHAGVFDGNSQQSICVIKSFVERLLLFHLNSRAGFTDLEEAQRFLDHPRDETKLRRQRALISEALHWAESARGHAK